MERGLFEGEAKDQTILAFHFIRNGTLFKGITLPESPKICIDGKVSFQKEVEWASFMLY